jgi:hypothetical protein
VTAWWYWILFAWALAAAAVIPWLWWEADHAPILDEDDLDDLTYHEWLERTRNGARP